jgi:hypothetical protein
MQYSKSTSYLDQLEDRRMMAGDPNRVYEFGEIIQIEDYAQYIFGGGIFADGPGPNNKSTAFVNSMQLTFNVRVPSADIEFRVDSSFAFPPIPGTGGSPTITFQPQADVPNYTPKDFAASANSELIQNGSYENYVVYRGQRVIPSFDNILPVAGLYTVTVRPSGGVNLDWFRIMPADAPFKSGSTIQGKARTEAGSPVVGQRVYFDANSNKRFDTGEQSVLTDSSGNWQFDQSIPNGGALVRMDNPPALTASNPGNNEWWHRVYAPGQTDTNDFVFRSSSTTSTGRLSGLVFTDSNLNGRPDTGEQRLSGRSIYIDANRNKRLDAGERIAWTNSNGEWAFNDLAPGGFLIRQNYATSEWRPVQPNNDEWWFNVTAGSNQSTNFGVVRINASLTGASKGKITLPGVTPSVFKKGVKIFYDADGDGVLDKNEKVVTTDSQGRFDFKLGSKKLDVSKIRVLGSSS